MIIASSDSITYVSDFRVEIPGENLEPINSYQRSTSDISDLVSALNKNVGEYQLAVSADIRREMRESSAEELGQAERDLLYLIREQPTAVAVALRFQEGSLIVLGTITITIVLGNPTLHSLLLSVGQQLLAGVAASGIRRAMRQLLERLGWRVTRNIVVVLVPPSQPQAPLAQPQVVVQPSAPSPSQSPVVVQAPPFTLAALMPWLAVIVIVLVSILVLLVALGFAAHLL